MHIVLLKNLFSAISSIIIFVICRSTKEYVHGEVHEEILSQTFSMFEPEQCLEMGNYKYSFLSKLHHILADGTGVFLFVFFFGTSCLF